MFGDWFEPIRRFIESILRSLGIRWLRVTVTPNQGPPGTQVVIHIRGALPGDPLTIQVATGTSSAVADASGQARLPDTMAGFAPGSTVPIVVLAGPSTLSAARASTQFRVTE